VEMQHCDYNAESGEIYEHLCLWKQTLKKSGTNMTHFLFETLEE
jgi:hypothetical protein